MNFPFEQLVTSLTQHAQTLGIFDRVQPFEADVPAGNKLVYEVWLGRVKPAPARSGLVATAVRVEMNGRVWVPMARRKIDRVDPDMAAAVAALMAAYTGDFDLGVAAAEIDVLGAYGEPLGGQGGYVAHNGQGYRIFDLIIPVVVDDAFDQAR